MFIYHFSRLIKSKLLWGFLALLMVFAFVVMDSCNGPSADAMAAGYLGDEPVDRRILDDASQTANILGGQSAYYLPQNAQIYGALLRGGAAAPESWPARRRLNWKIVAARAVAARHGLESGPVAAEQVLMGMFVGPGGVFSPDLYRAFLSANQYTRPKLFEATFANVWLPSQTAALAVFNAVGWASPMERDFALDAMHDKTVAYAATLRNTLKPEAIEVVDADLQAWYDNHKADYEVAEQRAIAYVEVPIAPFAEKITVEEMDAMQYYDDHGEEFKGTGTNATQTLPFEDVKERAIAKVKAQRALEEALVFANETLVAKAQTAGLAEAGKAYGAPKAATLRQDLTLGFQNARDVIAAAFEMDPEETPFNAVSGTDCVYLIGLEKVIPRHIASLDEVKNRVLADIRGDRMAKRLKTNGETIRGLLAAELAKGSAFDKAVEACRTEGLSATTAMTFVLSDSANLEIPHRGEILPAVASLGVGAVSDPLITTDDELVLVYVAERHPGDALAKATAKAQLAQNLAFGSAFQITSDWLGWILDREPPTSDGKVPILDPNAADGDTEE